MKCKKKLVPLFLHVCLHWLTVFPLSATLRKLTCIWKKYTNNEKIYSCRICKTRYHNGSYLLLLEKGKLQKFEISHEYFLLF